ncbi:hypothetical protein ACIRPJ_33290 [Streptomyces asoensis]|uniref:hypothetical protein n=1 Tax=Streptomyces asoensis TaxID=249586 RepID=UPI001675A277|nr:hypothetical protein [Streptomyces asoensis]GGQ97477.1 hypothetical protein GCM10010496_73030 [Streptomyces asoensis]
MRLLGEAIGVESMLVTCRIKTLPHAARPYRTEAVDEVRIRAADDRRRLRRSEPWASTLDPNPRTSRPSPFLPQRP